MAVSKCIKCGSTSFEMVEGKIQRSQFRMYFIQCASCGSVIATQEFNNTGALLFKLAEKLNIRLDD